MTPEKDRTASRLFVLDLSGGRVLSLDPEGGGMEVIAADCRMPDGIAVDVHAGHIYWTNMGSLGRNDGSIERVDLNGENREVIVPDGATHTPKQLHLDKGEQKLYWSDREGMRVMRANLDGSEIQNLIRTGEGDSDRREIKRWCVGISLDPGKGHIYWTQKGPDDGNQGRIFRAGINIPAGQTADDRRDIETLFTGLPEPIDLELDLESRTMYWTDRGDPPLGNTVNSAPMDRAAAPKILVSHLMEGIGLALDLEGQRMFVTDLGGSIYSARLDGSEKKILAFALGNLSGIAYVKIPMPSV